MAASVRYWLVQSRPVWLRLLYCRPRPMQQRAAFSHRLPLSCLRVSKRTKRRGFYSGAMLAARQGTTHYRYPRVRFSRIPLTALHAKEKWMGPLSHAWYTRAFQKWNKPVLLPRKGAAKSFGSAKHFCRPVIQQMAARLSITIWDLVIFEGRPLMPGFLRAGRK